MAAISNDWLEALQGEFKKPYYKQLFETVKKEYETHLVFPPSDDIFNAFHLTPLKDVKVVILGQDPYHNVGQAHGLCFSVRGIKAEADESAARTQAIIGAGVEKVKAALPLKSAI